MAKKERLPQNIQLLQRRFEDAQERFNTAYQARVAEYAPELSAFESRIQDYEAKAQAYVNDLNDYAQYMNSFFIESGETTPQTFVKYGDQFYWADDIAPGFNLSSIDQLSSLSGGQYEFVKTGSKKHSYWYSSYELVPSREMRNVPYTTYETQYVETQKLVSNWNAKPGESIYSYETVREPRTVPVTKYRMEWVDTSSFQNVPTESRSELELGYLRTQTPEGEFTTMKPEQFRVRTEPKTFEAAPPEAPSAIDVTDIKAELEKEKAYLQRETGEIRAASRRARMRSQARPLLS